MKRSRRDARCSVMVVLDDETLGADPLRELAAHLSEIAVRGFDVVVFDATSSIERNRRVLRWVSRYATLRQRHCDASGAIDPIRAAAELAACEKVIVADARIRYDAQTLDALCTLLDLHEVVEPETYFDPLPWWGGIEAARLLVRRGVGPLREHAPTFAFRKSAVSGFRALDPGGDCLCRLSTTRTEVFPAAGIFVRRIPPLLRDWFRDWPHRAGTDLGAPLRALFFCALLPLAFFLAVAGGLPVVSGFAAAVVCGSLAMAVRGRIGASEYFPLRACLFAPLAIIERAITIYGALLWRVLGGSEVRRIAVPVRNRGERAASGR